MKNHRFTAHGRAAAAVALGLLTTVTATVAAAQQATASASVPTALQRCQSGAAPDTSQTVYHPGTQVQVTYPTGGANPDNAIYPGDVVKVVVLGSLRYDATHWTGPAGTGTPDANGITPYSSTATFNNNPGGWVGRELPTVSLASCTSAPSYPVRTIYRLADSDLTDNAGGFTITTQVWRAPGRIVIDGTELTQGIQNSQQQVALIAGKRTFLRVFLHNVDDGNGPLSGVTGNLTVEGMSTTAYPIVNSSITTSTTGSDKRSLHDSLLFELPSAGTGLGVRQATLSVSGPASRTGSFPIVTHIPLSFGPSTSLTVLGIRYSYYNVPDALTQQLKATQPGLNVASGWWQARPLSAWEPLRSMAENALPLAHLTINDDAPDGAPYSVWGGHWFDCKAVQDANGNWGCSGYTDAKNWETTYVDQQCPNRGCYAMLLQPEIDSGENGTTWSSPAGNHVMNMQGEAQTSAQGDTLAHELGHSLGLSHTWQDPNYPRSDGGLGPFVALRYAPSFSLLSGKDAAGNTTAYDLMSYNRPAWFSPYSYCKAMAGLPGSHPLCSLYLVG
jgi:hypothetical protein